MKALLEQYRIPLLIIIAIIISAFAVRVIVAERLSDLTLMTQVLIAEQEGLLTAIAETTARNGADEATERVIRDCTVTERTSFDNLLSRLNAGLNRNQLAELERLFGRCGSFFAERKAVMVARLEREIEIYEAFVSQLENITGANVAAEYAVADWKSLADLERKQSELFSTLVTKQDEIITTLLSGKTATSPEIAAILEEVQSTQETLIVTHAQAAEVRASLVSL